MCIDLIKRNACWEIIRVIIGTDPGTYPGIQVYQKLKKVLKSYIGREMTVFWRNFVTSCTGSLYFDNCNQWR